MSRPAKFLIGIAAVVISLSVASSLIPSRAYLRFQLLKTDPNLSEARWIFERIHFDQRPIDVLIVGASNAQLGISASRMNNDFAQRGDPVEVVNFAMLFAGRNLNYVLVKEAFEAGRR